MHPRYLIIHWLKRMRIHEIINSVFLPHGNWKGLSYGQLTVLFPAYILHSLNHRLCGLESWVCQHKTVLESATGQTINEKDATDDRLGIMLKSFGEDDKKFYDFQQSLGKHTIQAYEIPTKIARYDTTAFNVHHKSDDPKKGILRLGHSKDRRPDLLQFWQGSGTLDPAGFPLLTDTIEGNKADDRLYVPAWRRMAETIGHKNFLYITDCKAGALETRATLSKEGGSNLFPLPMTGRTPALLKSYVLNPPAEFEKIVLDPRAEDAMKEDAEKRVVSQGVAITKLMEATLDGEIHEWGEQWMISQSDAHAKRKIKGFETRQANAEERLKKLKVRKDESLSAFQNRAEQILKKHKVQDFISLNATEFVKRKRKYIGRGRPGPDRPYKMEKIRELTLTFEHNENAIDEFKTLAGWRIFVTNVPADRMSLNQSSAYYRDEYLVERGFHRLKKGALPALPLFLRIEKRIKGLMLLLTVALQALSLLECVARRELAANLETLAGLVPGNPKIKIHRPTAERLLPQFNNIHMIVEDSETQTKGRVFESLNSLQLKILAILKIPADIYDLSFTRPKFENSS